MRAAVFAEPGKIQVADRPDPRIVQPTDAVVRVVLACVCGSDLWFYRGQTPYEAGRPGRPRVHRRGRGRRRRGPRAPQGRRRRSPPSPTATAPARTAGPASRPAASHGGFWASGGMDGGQGEAVRVPFADATLVRIPGSGHSDEMMRSLLALSDVMGTGHHAAVSAGVKRGRHGRRRRRRRGRPLGVLAAARLGAERIIALSRHEDRQRLAREFGATDIVARARRSGDRGGHGAHRRSRRRRRARVRRHRPVDGTPPSPSRGRARWSATSASPTASKCRCRRMFFRNVGLHGGSAPVRAYIPELMDDVLAGRIEPGRVFDFETDLDGIREAYAAMDERRAIKSLVRVGSSLTWPSAIERARPTTSCSPATSRP